MVKKFVLEYIERGLLNDVLRNHNRRGWLGVSWKEFGNVVEGRFERNDLYLYESVKDWSDVFERDVWLLQNKYYIIKWREDKNIFYFYFFILIKTRELNIYIYIYIYIYI